MTRVSTTVALLLTATLAATLSAQRGERGGRRGERDFEAPKLEHFTFTRGSFETELMNRGEARYLALLPKGHDDEANADKQYPWVLWLPGFGGATDFLNRGGAEILDGLRGAGKIPEMAVVIYSGGRSVYMNGERAGRTEDLLTGELLAHLHEKYRLSDEPRQRAVMGVSAGGFGALKLAMRHPDKFGAVAAHSSAILPADPDDLSGMYEGMVNRMLRRGLGDTLGDPIDPVKWAAHMPMGIAKNKKPADLKGLQIYFAAGTEDNYGFFPPNEEFAAALKANGHKHLFHQVEEGGHAWSSPQMRDSVAVSLQFVACAMRGEDAIAATKKLLEGADKAGDGK